MIFHNTNIEGVKRKLSELDSMMEKIGFFRGSWDYHQAIYDYEVADEENRYYIRVGGNVVGKYVVENPHAELVLQAPLFARHYFPHGLDHAADLPESRREFVWGKIHEVQEALGVRSS